MASPRFSLDTCAVIELCDTRYPKDLFPLVWAVVESAAANGQLLVSNYVVQELRREGPSHRWLSGFARTYPGLVVREDPDVQEALGRIGKAGSEYLYPGKEADRADPWVIAVAMARDAIVVTNESATGNARKVPRICETLRVACLPTLGMLRQLGGPY